MRAFTLLLLAACACLGANRAFAMDMGGMNMGELAGRAAGVRPSGPCMR